MKFALPEPSQPSESAWSFIETLKAPLWEPTPFQRRQARRHEVSLQKGVTIQSQFPDPDGRLQTAYADLDHFFDVKKISRFGPYPITIRKKETACYEAYRVEIRRDECIITAQDTEGVRRGIFFLEDEMLRTGGPLLPIGITERQPQIRTRLSRCFFGPINRPPKNRDELTDDVDYYPDEYLNRLSHQAVNGLWLTISFRDLCPSRLFPEHGLDSERRLEKLRRTVQKCARYGIKIYVFCIEPKGFGSVPEYLHAAACLNRYPELGGHHTGDVTYFCPSSPTAQAYLEESTRHLFSQVPDLGGVLGINLGERPTHCCSNLVWNFGPNTCPRCSKREPWQVFHDTLAPLWRGMHQINPDAELISWLYVPYLPDRKERSLRETEKMIHRVAAEFPKNVTFQYNFESMGTVEQLGKRRYVRDYSLAYVGPSRIFRTCAQARRKQSGRMSAKLQIGCSHEVATVPFVPAPGNLFEKYRAMHELGVSGAMQSWYFGNYPSLMTKAAGELSFAPFPRTEKAFLKRLAEIGWGEDGPVMARAWSLFSEAYRHFPANLAFAWYGPVHDAVAWPLHLKPVDAPIAPSWLLGFPPSGDRIGECVGFEHRLDEVIILCEKMHRKWNAGIRLLQPLLKKYRSRKDHLLEIGVAQAMNIQISSALNVLKFYAERERLYSNVPQKARKRSLAKLSDLVVAEIKNSTMLEKLSRADSRLGFHSEAEGYKYFPAKLRWRSQLLKALLRRDFPAMERRIEANEDISDFSKPTSKYALYECSKVASAPGKHGWKNIPAYDLLSSDLQKGKDWHTSWQAVHDGRKIYFRIDCTTPAAAPVQRPSQDFANTDFLRISIEPRRFWPTRDFYVSTFGTEYYDSKEVPLDRRWSKRVSSHASGWQAFITISLECLNVSSPSMLRLNVERNAPGLGSIGWISRIPGRYRLIFGDLEPSDLGWFQIK